MQTKAVHIIALCLLSTTLVAKKHHRALGEESGFNSNTAIRSNTLTGGAVQGNGNAQVQLAANNQGTNVAAVASQGAVARTSLVQNLQASQVNNGFNITKDKNGNVTQTNGFNNNTAEVTSTAGATQAYFGGNGGLVTGANVNGISGTAVGSNGAGLAGTYGQNQNLSQDTNGFIITKRLLTDKLPIAVPVNRRGNSHSHSHEDNNSWKSTFSDKSATKGAAASQTYGHGYNSLSIGRKGVATEAFGTKGAASKSALEQQNDSYLVNSAFANKGGKNYAFTDKSNTSNKTQTYGDARAYGEGGVKTNANKDGLDLFSKGAEGTQNQGGWNGSEENWRDSAAFTNNDVHHRRLNVVAQVPVHDDKNVDHKKIIDELKVQIVKLKNENEELKKKCLVNKKLGVSQ